MKHLTALALAVPLLATTGALAQQARPEGNTGSGAAMSGAQSQSSGMPAGTAAPQPNLHSPAPAGASNTPARRRPEGNLGSGAAMSGAQSQGMGAQPNAGSSAAPQPTQSPARPAR
ncbi:hypothetical protein E2C06_23465 [Dankookia rubra]|uniref:Proteophosphoglycan ppg4 n=1 Tax=Dankookia rubra TaxID=1442381 RepID=A0A4R5QBH2_9PROT|nr:hypothetical protein [Dankookia rubra]TDH60186.1 hypothetical protein E2C06_23465 [Dankookia rubra]